MTLCVRVVPDAAQMSQDELNTALFAVAAGGTDASMEVLIAAGADVNVRDEEGFTPLIRGAGSNPDLMAVGRLLASGADIDAQTDAGDTALSEALQNNQPLAVVRFLIDFEANPNTRSADGMTPLMLALGKADSLFVTNLVRNGADVNICNGRGETPLMLAVRRESPELLVLNILVHADEFSSKAPENTVADINAVDQADRTALMHAAKYGTDPMTVEFLLSAHADAKLRDNAGNTALDYARGNSALNQTSAIESLERASR